jgi:PAS domain S-box-containing protein
MVLGYELTAELPVDSRYKLLRALRHGDEMPVIIKTPHHQPAHQTEIAALEREFALLKDLPNEITHPVALLRSDRHCALAIEDAGGVLLSTLCESAPLDIAASLAIAIQLATALAELHRRDIIHGNLNPHGILVDPQSWRMQLINFSGACRVSAKGQMLPAQDLPLTSLIYTSPEQTGRMNRAVDYRTDFYSLGVCLYQLLTGACPFRSDDPLELIHAHIAKLSTPPNEINPKIPRALSQLVLKLLTKTAEERYQSALGLRADLEHCAGEWARHGEIPGFRLGSQDVSDRFIVPQHLYGREQQLAELLEIFDHVCEGHSALLLIAGYSGIGKTTLVRELYKPLVRNRGYFISGKFDQLERNIPYRALIQAFKQLIQRLLAEGEARLNAWRAALTEALGANAGVLAEVLPAIELILGKQPPAPPLAPTEAQNRFRMVLQNFLGVLARPEHPLVIFLDDLQWVDAATLKLLKPLLTSRNIRSLFLIGAYRDNEVSADHPLAMAQAELRKHGIPLIHTNLSPLNVTDLARLVCDSLMSKPTGPQPLADLIQRKTDGNPFFVIQFLTTLYQEGFITFDYEQGRWIYDTEAIAKAPITGNVVDLMSRKIRRLEPVTQHAVNLAAAVGSRFDLKTLAIVGEQTPETTRRNLQPSLQEGLILGISEQTANPTYSFLHDRVQQAAYALIPEIDRPKLHLKIGRLLLQQRSSESVEDQVFEIARHLNTGAPLIHDRSERLALVRLNLTAGRKAKSSAAWQAALGYFKAGIDLLADEHWRANYELSFALEIEAAECEYLTGDENEAERAVDLLLNRASTRLDKVRAYRLRIVHYEYTSRYHDAVRAGTQALALFNLAYPSSEAARARALDEELAEIERLVDKRPIASLVDLPVTADPEARFVLKLLTSLHTPCYLSGDKTLTLLNTSLMVRISLTHGYTEESALAFVLHAMHLGQIQARYQEAYDFGILALRINDRLPDPGLRAKILMNFSWAVSIWRKPVVDSFELAREAFRLGNETGLFSDAAYALFNECQFTVLAGAQLEELEAVCETAATYLERVKMHHFVDAPKVLLYWGRALRGLTAAPISLTGDSFDEEVYLRTHAGERMFEMFCFDAKVALLYTFGQYRAAADAAREAERCIRDYAGTLWDELRVYYHALTLCALFPESSPEEREPWRTMLTTMETRLKLWADNCPHNYLAQQLMLSAEIARIEAREADAMALYEAAIAAGEKQECPRELALANELCAKFCFSRGRQRLATAYLTEAREAYTRWGALAKVQELNEKYSIMRASSAGEQPRVSVEPPLPLDIGTVTKAARAISSEIILEDFLRRLLEIAMENAGAQRAVFVQQRAGKLVIAAAGGVEPNPKDSTHAELADRLALAAVNYVRSTGESMVVGNASIDERFASDPYVANLQPKSILCVPVIYQGEHGGILYMENNLATDAFAPERVRVMQILSAQAAISLHNAQLYDERRRAEAALKDSEAKYQDLYDNAPDMFASVDAADAKIIRCNLRFAQAMGYTRDEILGRPIFDMYPPDCLTQVRRNFTEFLKIGELRNEELQLQRKDGSKIDVMLNSSAVRDANGRILYSRSVWRDITELKRAETALKRALSEVEQLKNRLQAESAYLQEEIKLTHNFEEMVGGSPALQAVLCDVEVVAPTDATVLILGETGAGKELIARAVHDRSRRRERALVKVNCSAISAGLVESELFGHVKGAFTGALANRTGRFELAHGGTIFLDEIGELPLDTQVKLLRVLQEQEFEPVGSSRTVRVDVRIIAATNRDLDRAVQEGRFRADLYYRLNVFPVRLPSLRERREDIPQLTMFFMTRFAKKFGKRLNRVSERTVAKLMAYSWPGNVRELQNVIERAAILSQGSTLRLDWELPPEETKVVGEQSERYLSAVGRSNSAHADIDSPVTLEDVERRHIIETLRQTRGVIEGAKGAASVLNLRPSTLRARMKKLGINRSPADSA